MNPRTLLQLMPFIDEGVYAPKELAVKSGLGESLILELLRQLAANDIGRFEDSGVTFTKRDKMSSALLAVKMGCSIDEVSKQVGWRDFEEIVSDMLASEGYVVKKNFRLKKPKIEIDVLAIKNSDICLAIDCKQWRRTIGKSVMKRLVDRQIERAEHLAKSVGEGKPRFRHIYPIIATLYEEDVKMIDRVSIVPITKLTGFLREFEGCTESLKDIGGIEA